MKNAPILIAGGGIAGLASALALAPRPVLVLEQAIQFEEVGAGLQVGPNAVRALQRIGAWDAVSKVSSSPSEIHMRDGGSGRMLKRIRLGTRFSDMFGAPYRVAHRAELHEALLAVARSQPHISISNGAGLASFTENDRGILATLSNNTKAQGAALIGADGVKSVVRQTIHPGTVPEDGGKTLHRALFDIPSVRGDIDLACVNLWLCPGAHVVHYPVGRDQKLNVVATTTKGETPRTAYAGVCQTLQSVIDKAPSWLPWPSLYVRPLPFWNKGKAMVIGDAAHGTLPFLAQGAAMALEDTSVLADEAGRQQTLENTFAAVSARRTARTARLLNESLAAGARYQASGMMRVAQNAALTMMSEDMLLKRLAWIYRG